MKSVVFAFGRMNPPTTGHQLLVNKLVAYARHIGAAPRVYLSHSVGAKDPLQYDKKVAFARAAFGSLVKKSNARTVIEVLKQLEKEGYTHVTMFAGSDRVPEFTKLITKYNGKEYNFEKIEVKSAGERDPDADDVSGMSASKMRALAKDDKVAEFMRGAPNTLKAAQAKNMFTAVRRALLGEDVMDYSLDDKFISFIVESDERSDDIVLPSSSEVEKLLKNISISDLDLEDSDAMMIDIIADDDEPEKEKEVHEAVLSSQARQKLAQRMKGMSKRLARLRQIKAKSMPAGQRLRMRARKAAIMSLRMRATGRKDLDYNSLSRSQRIAVDTALIQRFGKKLKQNIEALATKILPMIRKKAQENVKKARSRDIKEGADVVYPGTKKRVPDQRKDNPLNVDPNKLTINTIDPTADDRLAPDPTTAHLNRNKKMRFKNVLNSEGRKSAIDKDARDPGDTNIIYQMRKVVNSRGEHETKFADGKASHISVNDAKRMLAKFDALRLPKDKHDFTVTAGKSLQAFRDVMAHGIPKEKPKISLGGRQFNEFYLGIGRTRTVSPYDKDEPPGTRNIGEVSKDEDRPDDPNKSRPLSQKMDLLLRLGLVDQDELQKYRRALRSSKKFALQSPQLREKLADLLDKLIDLTTKDPATYSRVRYNVTTKEALSLMNKAERSGVDIDVIFEVFSRGYEQNEDINEAFNRVNSFIAGGKASRIDNDLTEKVKAPTGGLKDACWSGYTAVGMKMKNGRKVPNCVPKEETHIDEAGRVLPDLSKSEPKGQHSKDYLARVQKQKDKRAEKKTAASEYLKMKGSLAKEEAQIDELSTDLLHRAAHKAAKVAMTDVQGRSGPIFKKRAAQANKFRAKGMDQEKKEKTVKEAKSNWDKQARFAKYDTIASRGSQKKAYVDRNYVPMKKDDAKVAADAIKAFQSTGGVVKKIPAGSKTIKSYVKPKKYMTPNQASRVTEQISTHDATPLSKRVKRVKSFHAWHPKNEAYTGSEPTSSNKNDPANRFVGTNSIVQNYASVTPGQQAVAGEISVAAFSPAKENYDTAIKRTRSEVDQSKQNLGKKHLNDIKKALGGIRESNDLNESFAAGFELAPFAKDYGITVESGFEHHPDVQAAMEATYKGKTVPLNKPMKGDVKKSKVYVDPDGDGIAKKVNFGDKKLSIKKDQPARKRSYCARSSGQGNLNNKSSANYWSRRAWDC